MAGEVHGVHRVGAGQDRDDVGEVLELRPDRVPEHRSVGNMLIIAGFVVTATTGPPDHERGLGTARFTRVGVLDGVGGIKRWSPHTPQVRSRRIG